MTTIYLFQRHFWLAIVLWTALIGGFFTVSQFMHRDDARRQAELVADAYVRKDLAFRRWVTQHGGVYVPPSAKTPPNPYLHLPDRDVVTTDGKALTLVNPAYATRQLLETFAESDGIRGKLTSLRLKNPGNAPEPWEQVALEQLERGDRKYSRLDTVRGGRVLRYMLPVYMESGCMSCHGDLGIPIGGVRGGFSVSMPLGPFETQNALGRQVSITGHGVVWLLGLGLLGFVRRRALEQRAIDEATEHTRRQKELCAAELLDINARIAGNGERACIEAGLEAAQHITASAVGYLHFINADQRTIELCAWSKDTLAHCEADYDQHYPLDQAGIWADCVRLRHAVLHNDYAAVAGRHGIPSGHIELRRHLAVPVVDGSEVRMIIGVGNKEDAYNDSDIEVLQALADGLWGIVTRVRADTRLRTSERLLRDAQEIAHLGGWEMDLRADRITLSDIAARLLGIDAPEDAPHATLTLGQLQAMRSADEWSEESRRVRAQAEKDNTIHLELRYRPTGRNALHLRLRGTVLRSPDGKPLRAIGTLQDITSHSELDLLRISTTNLSALFESADRIVWSVDKENRLIIANQAAQRFFALRFGKRIQPGDICLPLAATERERWSELYAQAQGGHSVSVDLDQVASDRRWLDMRVAPGGQDGMAIIYGIDLTERKRAELERQESLERMRSMVERLAERDRHNGLLNRLHDLLQSCRSENEAHEVIAPLFADLFRGFDAALLLVDNEDNTLRLTAQAGEAGIPDGFPLDSCWALRRGEVHEILAGGAPVCAHFSVPPDAGYCCQPMMVDADVVGLLSVRYPRKADEQVRENIHFLMRSTADAVKLSLSNLRLREALRQQAIHDPLTGLFNRRYLNDILTHELVRAQRDGAQMAVAMLDIDHFKRFNDEYGHEAGDLVLSEIGRILREELRRSDVPCRFGGEELAIVMPGSNAHNASERLQEVCSLIGRLDLIFRERRLPAVTLSAGVAETPTHGSDSVQLLHAADLALYRAKAEGRNRIVIAATPAA
ncbi:hypothetical protein CJ010_15095 [Azoarcus sp. DD4]|uniref:diguanylate cyclase n=1 Tax=Azoarcus sp. DD4 TaxID=2027405 RepID=UPI00112ECDBE|nr:diguanylate cyclase [Azoarcus sp. DD4]QDF97762.1 hypothetical protein CJ010_15095 [Azoarcus sp. DD4]